MNKDFFKVIFCSESVIFYFVKWSVDLISDHWIHDLVHPCLWLTYFFETRCNKKGSKVHRYYYFHTEYLSLWWMSSSSSSSSRPHGVWKLITIWIVISISTIQAVHWSQLPELTWIIIEVIRHWRKFGHPLLFNYNHRVSRRRDRGIYSSVLNLRVTTDLEACQLTKL